MKRRAYQKKNSSISNFHVFPETLAITIGKNKSQLEKKKNKFNSQIFTKNINYYEIG